MSINNANNIHHKFLFPRYLLVLNVILFIFSSPSSIGQGQWNCNFIFLLFSCMCFWHGPSLGFNLKTNFSVIRPMEFHRSGWFFKCQIDGTPFIRSLKFQNALHPFTLSMSWAELHFWPLGHLSNKFQGENTKKVTIKKFFFLQENWHFSENHSFRVSSCFSFFLSNIKCINVNVMDCVTWLLNFCHPTFEYTYTMERQLYTFMFAIIDSALTYSQCVKGIENTYFTPHT